MKPDNKQKQENRLVNQYLNQSLETLNEDGIRNFRGNPLLKRAGEKVELTTEHIEEYKRCMSDPIYFSERYIKIVHVDKGLIPIELYEYQKKLLDAFQKNRFNIAVQCRQSGKCVFFNTFITLRHPDYYNGQKFDIEIGVFYIWQYFKKLCLEYGLCA